MFASAGYHVGDCRELLANLPTGCVQSCVTSPPYWGLRDYSSENQIGTEDNYVDYVANLVGVFREVRRVLADDGTLWLNLGDSYANDPKWGGRTGGKHASALHGDPGIGRQKRHTGLPPKCLVGIPWRVSLALVDDGWTLRSDVIWAKPNPMPESVTDRPTKAHEYVFMLTKSERYYYDAASIAELSVAGGTGTRNARTVWTIKPTPFRGAHFATMPLDLAMRCIKAGTKPGDMVLDPFGGSGTTAQAAECCGRRWLLFDVNPKYATLAERRTSQTTLGFDAAPPSEQQR